MKIKVRKQEFQNLRSDPVGRNNVWPDFEIFLRDYLVFGNILNLLCQNTVAIGQGFTVAIGQNRKRTHHITVCF